MTNGNKNTRRKIKGGLKQKNPLITSWQAVYKMIINPQSRLTKIAYSSLKGFIFRLDVPQIPDNSEFLGLNQSGTAFTVPIYSLIFKFSIISYEDENLPNLIIPGDKDQYGNPLLTGREKEFEYLDEFKNEANIQQSIYLKTVNPTGKPICLAVVDFSIFDKPASDRLLRELLEKPTNDIVVNTMLQYLINNITSTRKLGMISMELANSDFRELSSIENKDAYNSDCIYAIAQILILFVKLKTLNYDCHSGNVLASITPPIRDETRAVLIDFGRTLNFNESDPFSDDANEIMQTYQTIKNDGGSFVVDLSEILNFDITSLYVSGRTTEDEVIDRMQKIIKFMAYLDYVINNTYFLMSHDGPQLIDLLLYLYGPNFSTRWKITPPNFQITPEVKEKYKNVIATIRVLTEAPLTASNRISGTAISRMINNGQLFFVNKPTKFYNRSDFSKWNVVQVQRQMQQTSLISDSTLPKNKEEPISKRIRSSKFGGKSKKYIKHKRITSKKHRKK
jgi:hypothetical protein